MAAGATVFRFSIGLSLVERGVYQSLELRVAQHPSESQRFLLGRVIGYCLFWEDGLEFGRGISTQEEPAAWLRDVHGRTRLWLEVGQPSAERLHRASKSADRVALVTYGAPDWIARELGGAVIHRAEKLEIVRLDAALLDALAARLERSVRWELVESGDRLYVTVGADTLEGALERPTLAAR